MSCYSLAAAADSRDFGPLNKSVLLVGQLEAVNRTVKKRLQAGYIFLRQEVVLTHIDTPVTTVVFGAAYVSCPAKC